ncbi:MAG: hypothetical protein VCA38_21385 [Roseibacillus sp.]
MPPDLQHLRQQLQERFPEAHQSKPSPAPVRTTSRLPAFPSGALSELSPAGPASGLSLVLAELLQRSEVRAQEVPADGLPTPDHEPLGLIDGRDSFDPASYGLASCSRLLWVRCRDAEESLRCTDLLLHDGNLPLLVLDLQLNPHEELRQIPTSSWYRLRNLAKQSGTALLVFTPKHFIPCATLQLTFGSSFSLGDLEELQSTFQCSETSEHQVAVNEF